MSSKNFMAYGDAETVLTGFANDIKDKQNKELDTQLYIGGQYRTTVEAALGALNTESSNKAKVYIYSTATIDMTSDVIYVQTNSRPSLRVNDLFILKFLADYTYNGSSSKSWAFEQYEGQSQPTISWPVNITWADGSKFNQDIVAGTCLTLLYTGNTQTVPSQSIFTIVSLDVAKFDPSSKTDKVISATSGNLAGLDSNGNLTDSGIAASNVVVKSSTAGLLKNNGTVDTTTYASEQGVESLIDSTVGWTGKNLLNVSKETQENFGITVVPNADGSVNVYGTATDTSVINIKNNVQSELTVGKEYILSGCPSGGSDDSYRLDARASGQATIIDYGLGATFTYTQGYSSATSVYVCIRIKNGTNMGTEQEPTVFYPMVRLATVTDSTYEPYHKSVDECLEEINDKLSYLEQSVTLSTSASTTVTFTDASITANSFIEYACSVWDLVPESITGAAGSCTIVLPKVDSAQSVTVRIYVR